MPDQKPDPWDSFETYKGPPQKELPPWLDGLCKWFFAIVGMAIVFSVCGGLLTLYVLRHIKAGDPLSDSAGFAWAIFIGGGVAGVIATLAWWRRSSFKRD